MDDNRYLSSRSNGNRASPTELGSSLAGKQADIVGVSRWWRWFRRYGDGPRVEGTVRGIGPVMPQRCGRVAGRHNGFRRRVTEIETGCTLEEMRRSGETAGEATRWLSSCTVQRSNLCQPGVTRIWKYPITAHLEEVQTPTVIFAMHMGVGVRDR